MKYRAILIAIAPEHPPCFIDRSAWVMYLEGVEGAARVGHPGVLLHAEVPPTFNWAMNFCRDCTIERAKRFDRQGKCRPDHLARIRAASADEVPE